MDSVIEIMKAKGFTYLGVMEDEKIFCNLDSDESIKNCLEFLEKITGEEWKTFREASGNKNLVFYRTSMFERSIYLHFKGGNKIELPLNCSSCDSMFFNCVLPEGFSLGDNFDTSKVVDMDFMFYNCKLPEDFSLGDKFDTSSVEDMNYMFQNCILPEGFSLGEKFDISSVLSMYGMFYNCKLPEGFSLGEKFDTSSVMNMHSMFTNAKLPEGFSLGEKFDTSSVEDMHNMFFNCELPEGKTREDFKSEAEIIKWLKSRNKQGIDKQSTEKLIVF